MEPVSKRMLGHAVVGSRIDYLTAGPDGPEPKTGTVSAIVRRTDANRSTYYRISEDPAAEIEKSSVTAIRTPGKIKDELIECLVGSRVLENIRESQREVAKVEVANAPYLKAAVRTEKIGSIRI